MKRAKLYYLRDRKGKSARIAEKIKKKIGIDISLKSEEQETAVETNVIKSDTPKEPQKSEIKKDTQKIEVKKKKRNKL